MPTDWDRFEAGINAWLAQVGTQRSKAEILQTASNMAANSRTPEISAPLLVPILEVLLDIREYLGSILRLDMVRHSELRSLLTDLASNMCDRDDGTESK